MRLPRSFVVLAAGCCVWPCSASVAATSLPVRFAVTFADGARLGDDTPMTLAVHVDKSLAPVTELRLLTPPGLTLVNSRLGVAACRRSQAEILRVKSPVTQRPCPRNSLLGVGTATAGLVLNEEQTLYGAAAIELHAGAPYGDKPGLFVTADTYSPIRIHLTYAGYLYVPHGPFGLGMAILVQAIPEPSFTSPLALSRLRLTVGAPSIQYHRSVRGRRTWYRPGGVPLPNTCPRGGFRFRVVLRFADGMRRSVDAITPCPARRP